MSGNFDEGLCDMLHRLWNADDNDDYNGESSTDNIKPYTNDGVPIRKLFVGNLARRTSSKDLTTLFSAYGKVEACHLKVAGRSNFAFVTFANVEDALEAVKDGHRKSIHLHCRDLRVMPADSWHQPDSIENRSKNDQKKAKFTEISTQYELNEDSQIHSLNDDCLIHIFSFLPIADRVRFERVCRRWRIISHASWSSFKKLDLTPSTWGFSKFSSSYPQIPQEIDTPTLYKVLLRTGEFLSHLDLSTPMAEKLSKSTMGVIGRLCPNLQDIDVTELNVSAAGIKSLAKNCTKIVKFSLGHCTGTCDTDLSTLFTQNKNLRYLKLKQNSITGKCLLSIPSDSIQEICLEECNNISPCHFSTAIQTFTNLHTLSLERCVSFNDQAVKGISSRIDSLKKLHLCNYFPMINEKTMLHITGLINLETLNVSQNSCVNDPFLLAVGTKCKQLKNVDISSCHQVSNEGLCHITSLPKLECLKVSYLGHITDSALTDMPNLKTLECRGCPSVGSTGLISLIGESHSLQLMDLSGCDTVENEFIEAAVKATINRSNGIVCKIYVGGTGVDVTKIDKVSPLLQVLRNNLSDNHLRPDFDHDVYNYFPDDLAEMSDMDDYFDDSDDFPDDDCFHDESADFDDYYRYHDDFSD